MKEKNRKKTNKLYRSVILRNKLNKMKKKTMNCA